MPIRFWSRGLAALAVCLGLATTAGDALAQQNSLFGGSGPSNGAMGFGTASTSLAGGGTSSGAGMQSGGFPAQGFPGAAGGAGGTGMSLGASGFGAGQGMTGAGGTTGQRTGFVGQSNTRFVGNAQAGQNPGQNQNIRQNTAGNRRTGQNQNQNQGAGGAGQQRSIRPRLVVSFTPPRPSTEKVTTTLSTRFQKLSDRAGFENVTVEAEGNRVILRGEVASTETSRLAGMLARLEPGVRSVTNELTVKPPAPSVD